MEVYSEVLDSEKVLGGQSVLCEHKRNMGQESQRSDPVSGIAGMISTTAPWASHEEMFDRARLKETHTPEGHSPPNVTLRAIPGHEFGVNLNAEDKARPIAFLRTR